MFLSTDNGEKLLFWKDIQTIESDKPSDLVTSKQEKINILQYYHLQKTLEKVRQTAKIKKGQRSLQDQTEFSLNQSKPRRER